MSETTMTMDRPNLRAPTPDIGRLDRLSEGVRGDGFDRRRLATGMDAVGAEKELVASIQRADPSANGNARELARDLRTYTREGTRKEMLYRRSDERQGVAPNTQTEAAPAKKPHIFRRSWEWVKRNKLLTGALVLGGVLATAYASGHLATGMTEIGRQYDNLLRRINNEGRNLAPPPGRLPLDTDQQGGRSNRSPG